MKQPPRPTAAEPRPGAGTLRLLAACTQCKAQYDVSDLPVEARFHCTCGAVVGVTPIRPHEAAVVRCSACGAPRQGKAAACSFCGSDFTIHERDLHTICPACAARISDRGRFCHGCGLAISVVSTAREATQKGCPACVEERRLSSRELGGEGLTVLECHFCAGLWLGAEAFRLVEKRARQLQGTPRGADPAAVDKPPAGSSGRAYRPCPECNKLMHRRNYGRRSGVIVDQCTAHGLWFDHGELERILRWIHDGGLTRSEELDRLKHREERRPRVSAVPISPLFEPRSSRSDWGGLICGLVDFLSFFD